jgi:hypothetical protein
MHASHQTRSVIAAAVLFAGLAPSGAAQAQDFPARALRMIVPYPAGGSVDLPGRAFAERMQAALGQPIAADNRAGATGVIAHQAIARAAPDARALRRHGCRLGRIHPRGLRGDGAARAVLLGQDVRRLGHQGRVGGCHVFPSSFQQFAIS